MLSEQHDTIHIKYWLEWWWQQINTVYIPKEIVTDMSPSLQNAICMVFNGMLYKEFLEECFRFIKGETSKLPPCWVRIDIAHLIVDVTRWPCFKGNDAKRFKEFYVRCIGYLSTLDNLTEITKTIKEILLIATTKFDEDDPEVVKARDRLLKIFQDPELYDHENFQKEVYKGEKNQVPSTYIVHSIDFFTLTSHK